MDGREAFNDTWGVPALCAGLYDHSTSARDLKANAIDRPTFNLTTTCLKQIPILVAGRHCTVQSHYAECQADHLYLRSKEFASARSSNPVSSSSATTNYPSRASA